MTIHILRLADWIADKLTVQHQLDGRRYATVSPAIQKIICAVVTVITAIADDVGEIGEQLVDSSLAALDLSEDQAPEYLSSSHISRLEPSTLCDSPISTLGI